MKQLMCIIAIFLVVIFVVTGCAEQREGGDTKVTKNLESTNITDGFEFSQYEIKGFIKDCQKLECGTQCDTYSFLYDSDGLWIKGFISIPKSCIQEKTPYNCIVYNRGGNANMGYVKGEEIAAICDATGRVVIASQYRGAVGCDGTDEFGGTDVSDVIALIDLCEQEFEFASINNLCMVGVSRGGMMSYIAARQDTRVKGVVAVSAVTDLMASYNEREDMKAILSGAIGGSPEDMPQEYYDRSAINWAEEIEVPVYIIHSINDEMVSFNQAEAMNEKLESLQKDITFRVHEDDVHGIHKEDIPELVEWINQKLPRS